MRRAAGKTVLKRKRKKTFPKCKMYVILYEDYEAEF